MTGQTYDERNIRVTVALPKLLHNTVTVKLKFSKYATISELIRSLLRGWVETEILKVEPIGRMSE